jgi:signal transduction histidine kinase
MLSSLDSTYLCQLTAAQIQEILVLNGVLIQQYQSQSHRWIALAQLPDTGQLILNLEPNKVQDIDLRLHRREIVEFTAMTKVMNLNICDRYVFIPILDRSELWGRICLLGNPNSVWTSQDISWVQALGQQLLTAINMMMGMAPPANVYPNTSSPLADLAELIEQISELESLCQSKNDFINNISHDLRAPLMNIKMAVRMLKISLATDSTISNLLLGHPAEKYLRVLDLECDREVELINDILDLQRLELAIDQIHLEPVELATWLPKTIEPFIQRTDTRGQKLTIHVPEQLPTVATDRFYLTKIITELLNNACKYTHVDGKIVVSVDPALDSGWLTIVIGNQAEIDQKYLPHIFDQFYRVPGADRSQQGGTGLGLSLVKKLVTQLNGQICVASNEGWMEFSIKLPVGDRE